MSSNLYLPQGLPCAASLGAKTYKLQQWQVQKNTLRVLFLNLMPVKEETEADIARILQATDVPVQLLPMKISGQQYKNTSMEHMQQFYLDFQSYEPYFFDRLIITGAPLEQIPFEQVHYWSQLQHIMHWADTHVDRTLYICWAAQAGLYEHYGIDKHLLPQKMFGVFKHQVMHPDSYLMKGLTPTFNMPNSRHTEVDAASIEQKADQQLQIIAMSNQSGVGVVATINKKRTFIVGHLEYASNTLDKEYHRDLSKKLPIQPPKNYYTPNGSIDYSWQRDAVIFYRNWLI